jgi:DNA-binding NtrC family response regulator
MSDVTAMDVLVVDEDETMRSMMALRLQMLGHEVRTAASIEEAVAVLEAERVEAVVSDGSAAGDTGFDLLAYVRARWPDLMFILSIRDLDGKLEALAYSAGADWVFESYDLAEALPELFPTGGLPIAA